MKKKLKTLLLASVLGVMAFGLTGCGQGKVSQEQKEAVEYYENLGIGKEDAEDLAEAIVGNGSANNNASEENIDNAAESSLPVKEPEMIPGKTKDSEGRTLMSVQCVMPYMIDKNEEYHGFVGMHCYMYSWAFRNEDGTYAREFVITSSELEPCEYPDKEDWTYSEFGGVTTPRDECFECIKCHILDEGSLDFHLAKIYEEAGKTYDAELFTNRSQNWIETSLAPIAKDTYSIRE